MLEIREDAAGGRDPGTNLVITMTDHRIVKMVEHRRTSTAHRRAAVGMVRVPEQSFDEE